MAKNQAAPKNPLSKHWKQRVRSTVPHVISLGQYAGRHEVFRRELLAIIEWYNEQPPSVRFVS